MVCHEGERIVTTCRGGGEVTWEHRSGRWGSRPGGRSRMGGEVPEVRRSGRWGSRVGGRSRMGGEVRE